MNIDLQQKHRTDTAFENLFSQMQHVDEPPAGLRQALQKLPGSESLPTLWETWLLFTLIEYRQRQDWARKLIKTHLPEAVPPCSEFLEEDQPVKGLLPGHPSWKYLLECDEPAFGGLMHIETNEFLSFDIGEPKSHPLILTDSFLMHILPSSRWTGAGRLHELLPSRDYRMPRLGWDAIDRLIQYGLLEAVHDNWSDDGRLDIQANYHRLTDQAMDYSPVIREFCKSWAEPQNRLWGSALIGDWFLVHELAVDSGDPELIRVAKERRDKLLS